MSKHRRPPQLGELERVILARLWSHGPSDVKAMQRVIGEARGIKPNTVQSTLDRLHRKGLAEREKVGRAYVYRASVSQREWVVRTIETVLGDVPHSAPDLLLSAFVDLAERTGTDQLDALERLVRARPRSGRQGGAVSATLGTLALMATAGIGFAVGTSLLLAAGWPLVLRSGQRRHPDAQARLALAAAIAPGVAPILMIGLCLAPGALGLLGLHADHCVQHAAHPHLCLVHPTAMLTVLSASLLVLAFALYGAAALRVAAYAARTRRSVRALRSAASRCVTPGVHCVDSERPFSVTAGLGQSEIYLSSALADALAPAHLDAVIEHERAHAGRRDGLRMLAARVLSWPHLPPVRRSILASLELATERACDEQAGDRIRNRLAVAEAILAAERLMASAPSRGPEPLLAFGGSSVPARVQGLLSERPVAGRRIAGWGKAAVGVIACVLLADSLHHVTEHVLGLLLGTQ